MGQWLRHPLASEKWPRKIFSEAHTSSYIHIIFISQLQALFLFETMARVTKRIASIRNMNMIVKREKRKVSIIIPSLVPGLRKSQDHACPELINKPVLQQSLYHVLTRTKAFAFWRKPQMPDNNLSFRIMEAYRDVVTYKLRDWRMSPKTRHEVVGKGHVSCILYGNLYHTFPNTV